MHPKADLTQAHRNYVSENCDLHLNKLLAEVSSYALTLCRKRAINDEDAEEVAQDTALKVWSKLADYDPARSSIKTWVHRCTLDQVSIARRKAEAHARDLVAQGSIAVVHRDADPSQMRSIRNAAGTNVELVDLVATLGDVSAAARQLGITTKAAVRRLERIAVKINFEEREKRPAKCHK